jgi:putative ABC transport system permease protein
MKWSIRMRIIRIAREGVRSLLAQKLHAFFMMAGTVIGIAALVVIMAAGRSTQVRVMERVNSFGPNMIQVTAGGGTGFSPAQEGVTTLRLVDARAIEDMLGDAAVVAPFSLQRNVTVTAGPAQHQTFVMGIEPEWHDAWEWYPAEGQGITDEDVATMARVCVLGLNAARELFGTASPVGQYVEVGNVRLLVKGVLEYRGQTPGSGDFDSRMVVPLSTAMRRMYNQDYISVIRLKAKDARQIVPIAEQIRRLLHERHHITPPQQDDFAIFTSVEVANQVRGISGVLNALLTGLSGLSLIVGGIVLMNILLISVGERRREIGLRRALGAGHRDIFVQFLAESWTVTFIGMALGEAAGAAIALVLSRVFQLPFLLSWESFAIGAVFAFLVGTVFGLQPALRAARLNPVIALRS